MSVDFRHGLSDGQTADLSMPNQLLIGGIRQYESVLRPLQKGGKARRPRKYLSQMMQFVRSRSCVQD
jgi:hypothetical protein